MPAMSVIYEVVFAILVLAALAWMWGGGFFSILASGVVNATKPINVTGPFTGGTGNWANAGFTTYLSSSNTSKYIIVAAASLIIIALIVFYFAGEGSEEEEQPYYYYYSG